MITHRTATEELLWPFDSFIPFIPFVTFTIAVVVFRSIWMNLQVSGHASTTRSVYYMWWSHFLVNACSYRWWAKRTKHKRKHHMLCCIYMLILRWMIFCKILYRNYGWPPLLLLPPPLERVCLYSWCLGIYVTHRWLLCCCCWPVLLVYFYYSIILIVQRMRYLSAYTI